MIGLDWLLRRCRSDGGSKAILQVWRDLGARAEVIERPVRDAGADSPPCGSGGAAELRSQAAFRRVMVAGIRHNAKVVAPRRLFHY